MFARKCFTFLLSELSIIVLENPGRRVRILENSSVKYGVVCQFIVKLTTVNLLVNGFQINKCCICQSEFMHSANTMTEWVPPRRGSEANRLGRGSNLSSCHYTSAGGRDRIGKASFVC